MYVHNHIHFLRAAGNNEGPPAIHYDQKLSFSLFGFLAVKLFSKVHYMFSLDTLIQKIQNLIVK